MASSSLAPSMVLSLLLLLLHLADLDLRADAEASGNGVDPVISKDCLDVDVGVGVGSGGFGAAAGSSSSLRAGAYDDICPEAESIVFAGVQLAVSGDPRMAASLLRLHFHDCFVLGCDASVLLDDTAAMVGEKTAGPNVNSLRGFEVIDDIKREMEMQCPNTVSCADILAIAARDSVVMTGGPTWQLELGRMDGVTASFDGANTNIPGPNSTLENLIHKFKAFGLQTKDMVALSGGHTIGKARCATFSARLISGDQSNPSIGSQFVQSLQQLCTSGGSSTLTTLDPGSPTTFDGNYYSNLLNGEGLLPSDQTLVSTGEVADLVKVYASDTFAFFEDFKSAMLKMARIGVVVAGGDGGEIRSNCRAVNK